MTTAELPTVPTAMSDGQMIVGGVVSAVAPRSGGFQPNFAVAKNCESSSLKCVWT
ncbi:MAG: hypothetical protein AB7U82_30855 [Blastocatellales bacterium]